MNRRDAEALRRKILPSAPLRFDPNDHVVGFSTPDNEKAPAVS